MLYTPNVTATLLANYVWKITGEVEGFVRGDYEYTGTSYGSFLLPAPGAPNPAYIDPSYNVVNLSLGASVRQFELSVFAKNLLNNQHHPAVARGQLGDRWATRCGR